MTVAYSFLLFIVLGIFLFCYFVATRVWIKVDEKNKKVKFVRTPKFEEVPYPVVMEPNLVIEYYSR